MPEYRCYLKRAELATLVNETKEMAKHTRIKGNKIDALRDSRAIPTSMFQRPPPDSRIGFFYAREAVEWIVLSITLETGLGFKVADAGTLLDNYRNKFKHDLTELVDAFGKSNSRAELLEALRLKGVNTERL